MNPSVAFIYDAELRDELARVAPVSLDSGVTISTLDPRPYFPSGQELLTVDAGGTLARQVSELRLGHTSTARSLLGDSKNLVAD